MTPRSGERYVIMDRMISERRNKVGMKHSSRLSERCLRTLERLVGRARRCGRGLDCEWG